MKRIKSFDTEYIKCWKPVGGFAFLAKYKGKYYLVNEYIGNVVSWLKQKRFFKTYPVDFDLYDEKVKRFYQSKTMNQLQELVIKINTFNDFEGVFGIPLERIYKLESDKAKEGLENEKGN